jgi:hypothetical protein
MTDVSNLPCLSVKCRFKLCIHLMNRTAHKVEHPLHVGYLAAVYYTSHAAYGYIALACCIAMLFSMFGDKA